MVCISDTTWFKKVGTTQNVFSKFYTNLLRTSVIIDLEHWLCCTQKHCSRYRLYLFFPTRHSPGEEKDTASITAIDNGSCSEFASM